jgi:hypothetical protein
MYLFYEIDINYCNGVIIKLDNFNMPSLAPISGNAGSDYSKNYFKLVKNKLI